MEENNVEFLQRIRHLSDAGYFYAGTSHTDMMRLLSLAETGRQHAQIVAAVNKLFGKHDSRNDWRKCKRELRDLAAPPSAPVLPEPPIVEFPATSSLVEDFTKGATALLDRGYITILNDSSGLWKCSHCGIWATTEEELHQHICLPEGQPQKLEGVCELCGKDYPTPWFAPNALWNTVIPGRVGMLCPNCFLWKATIAIPNAMGWEIREKVLPISDTSGELDAAVRAVYESRPERDLPRAENRRGDTSGEGLMKLAEQFLDEHTHLRDNFTKVGQCGVLVAFTQWLAARPTETPQEPK